MKKTWHEHCQQGSSEEEFAWREAEMSQWSRLKKWIILTISGDRIRKWFLGKSDELLLEYTEGCTCYLNIMVRKYQRETA